MSSFRCGFLILFVVMLKPFGVCRAQTANAAEELTAYCKSGEIPETWQRTFADLRAESAESRRKAAIHVLKLLDQSLKDEESGKAPWRATPYWGSSGENPARKFRQQVVQQLKEPSVEVIPVLRWLLYQEKVPSSAVAAAQALIKVQGKEADALLADLATAPHPNQLVAVLAIGQIVKRKSPVPSERLSALATHHRAEIRKAASAVAKDLKLASPKPFDPVAAMTSPPIEEMMEQFSGLILDVPPRKAEFVVVTTTTYYQDDTTAQTREDRGWLLKQNDKTFQVLTRFGTVKSYQEQRKPSRADDRSWSTTCTFTRIPIREEVNRVVTLRKNGDPASKLSEYGGLSGQFEGRGAGFSEFLLAYWLCTSEQNELAAKILFPALDTLYLDHQAVDIVRDGMGRLHGHRMLVAFVGDRDYDATLAQAEVIKKRLSGTRFDKVARELTRQIPKRRDDFKELILPSSLDWTELQKDLSRENQIDYLCRRLRLLNGFQWGQPARVSLRDSQTLEPNGLTDNASYGLDRGKTPVINPLVELEALNPTVADIPAIAPYLRDDWFLLAVGYFRDFHPSRTLQRTRPLYVAIINNAARQEICSVRDLDSMSELDLDREIQRIVQWAVDNVGKNEATLLLDAVNAAHKEGMRWYYIKDKAERLAELKVEAALPTMRAYLIAENTNQFDIASILRLCRMIDAKMVQEDAEKYLDHAHIWVRLEAALILWKTDHSPASRNVILEILKNATSHDLLNRQIPQAVEALLEDGSFESRKLAANVFASKAMTSLIGSHNRPRIVRMFNEAEVNDGYYFYLDLLRAKGHHVETYAREVLEELGPNGQHRDVLAEKNSDKPDLVVAAAERWLKAQIAGNGFRWYRR